MNRPSTPGRILVVGGGLAGATAAIALARGGREVELIDLKPRPAGAAITLLNRAIDALDEIGVLDELVEKGIPVEPADLFRYYDAAGEPIPVPLPPRRHDTDLPHGLIIYRPDLARTLLEAAERAGVTVRIGVGIAGLIDNTSKSVTVELTDGTTEEYDLVIGADGVHSTTRRLLFGDDVIPTYSGTTMFRWVVDGIPDVGPTGFYQSRHLIVTLRLRDGRVYIATGREFDERPKLTQNEARDLLRENLSTFTSPLHQELLARLTDDETVIVNDYNWVLTPTPWHRGRVLLIGDAAHATTAHLASGGGMAIEDGVVLGQEIARGGSVDEVFGRFMERRFKRAKLVVETSVEINRLQDAGAPVEQQNALRGKAMGILASPY